MYVYLIVLKITGKQNPKKVVRHFGGLLDYKSNLIDAAVKHYKTCISLYILVFPTSSKFVR